MVSLIAACTFLVTPGLTRSMEQHCCWQQIAHDLSTTLQKHGFDIVHALPAQLFNTQSPQEHQLPTFGRGNTLAVVIGNSNNLWQPFLNQIKQEPQLSALQDPLDAYVEQHVTAAVQCCCCCKAAVVHEGLHASSKPQGGSQLAVINHELRFSHHVGPKFVNMLRAAQLSGLAYYSSTTHLCMHPIYGPWFALRAVAVFDCDGPEPASYSQLPCPHPDLEEQAAQAMKKLEGLGGLTNWQQHWREWAELRSIGGKYTDARYCYSPDQLEYHYTKSKDVLARAVNSLETQWKQQASRYEEQEIKQQLQDRR